jgi:hypothetical protein
MPDPVVEAIVKIIEDEGGGPGSSLHSWRCSYPDRYGQCDCIEVTAGQILDALKILGWTPTNT